MPLTVHAHPCIFNGTTVFVHDIYSLAIHDILLAVHATLLAEHGTPLIAHVLPMTVQGTPLTVHGTSLTVHSTVAQKVYSAEVGIANFFFSPLIANPLIFFESANR